MLEEAAIINSRIRKRILSENIPVALIGEEIVLHINTNIWK